VGGGAKNVGWGKLVSASVSATLVRILQERWDLGKGERGGPRGPHFHLFFSAHNTGQRGPDGAAQTSFFGGDKHLPFHALSLLFSVGFFDDRVGAARGVVEKKREEKKNSFFLPFLFSSYQPPSNFYFYIYIFFLLFSK